MTARLFSFNSMAGAQRSVAAVVDGDTTAGRFDSTYVANCIKIPGASAGAYFDTPAFMDNSGSATTLWFRFDMYGQVSTANNGNWIEFLNSSGTPVLQLQPGRSSSNSMALNQWNGSTYNLSTVGYTNQSVALRTFALKVVCGASGSIDIYVGGTLMLNLAVNQASVNNIAKARVYCCNGIDTFYSQIMGADYDIRDAHFMPAAINGNSPTNTSGTGSYTDINETVLDDTTNNVISTVGQKKGQVHASITVPTGYGISGLVMNARGRVSGGVVADGKLGVKSSSTSSSSTARVYNGGYEPRGAIFQSDPNTGGAWTQTNFNAAETYIEAA